MPDVEQLVNFVCRELYANNTLDREQETNII
jgi:hypothetical protein